MARAPWPAPVPAEPAAADLAWCRRRCELTNIKRIAQLACRYSDVDFGISALADQRVGLDLAFRYPLRHPAGRNIPERGELALRNHLASNRSIHIALGDLRRLFRPLFSCLGSSLALRLATLRSELTRTGV